ncbi:hypothetical protein E4U60_004924 [Claviceps pazoutovae]|uniref:Uncharacterized protein n=1 Tax=Claviceps pazoutovae TaxID=1649127 RepID=A0A9P7M8H9_9HYPO|nr:hypothetical protein E4U60_004924 [Claviceps pazoutovae]
MDSSPARPATEATASASRAVEDTTAVRMKETSTTHSIPLPSRLCSGYRETRQSTSPKRRLKQFDEQDVDERDEGPITSSLPGASNSSGITPATSSTTGRFSHRLSAPSCITKRSCGFSDSW